MRLISKKIWIISFILLIPYVFIYVICFHRTDKEALMPGGLSNVNSLIEIDSDNKEEVQEKMNEIQRDVEDLGKLASWYFKWYWYKWLFSL